MMKTEIAEDWAAALRSGKYKQGKGWLRKDDRFCCLGVLCDITVGKWSPSGGMPGTYSCLGSDTFLPCKLQVECEIDSDLVIELTWANDSGKSFNGIADMITEYNSMHGKGHPPQVRHAPPGHRSA
jgi:hypothetical protein